MLTSATEVIATTLSPCPPGYFFVALLSYCFKGITVKGYDDYKSKCKAEGAQLAGFSDASVLRAFFTDLAERQYNREFFVGLKYMPNPATRAPDFEFEEVPVKVGNWRRYWLGDDGIKDFTSRTKCVKVVMPEIKFRVASCDEETYGMCMTELTRA